MAAIIPLKSPFVSFFPAEIIYIATPSWTDKDPLDTQSTKVLQSNFLHQKGLVFQKKTFNRRQRGGLLASMQKKHRWTVDSQVLGIQPLAATACRAIEADYARWQQKAHAKALQLRE